MFQINDKVIYPGHGVANVESIAEKNVGGSTVKFLKLSFLFKDMTILVPLYNETLIGLRYPSSSETLEETMGVLCKKPDKKLESIDFTPSGWNRRNKEYQMKILSGQLIEIAKIYRDLMYISLQKDLSFGERTLLQNIEDLLAQEIQVVKNTTRESVIQDIRSPFKHITEITQMSLFAPGKTAHI
jgi:CarD family transcriptional regulator